MCYSLPWTPVNRCAKFDAASFILGREIHNRTNTHTHKITKTVTNISTPCQSACMDNKWLHTMYKKVIIRYLHKVAINTNVESNESQQQSANAFVTVTEKVTLTLIKRSTNKLHQLTTYTTSPPNSCFSCFRPIPHTLTTYV